MNSSQVLGTPPSMCILSIFTLHVRTCIYTCSMCVHCVCVYMYVSVLCLSICVDVCRHVCIVYIHVSVCARAYMCTHVWDCNLSGRKELAGTLQVWGWPTQRPWGKGRPGGGFQGCEDGRTGAGRARWRGAWAPLKGLLRGWIRERNRALLHSKDPQASGP